MRIEWRGGPTAILEKGGLRVLTDPMLSLRGPAAFVLPKHPSTGAPDAKSARYTEPPAHPLGELSLIIPSHNHADHFDERARELLPKKTLFVLPPNALGLRTMDADEAVKGMEILRPRLTVPIHHTTFGHYREPIEALEQRVAAKGLAGLRVPREGVVEVLEPQSTN